MNRTYLYKPQTLTTTNLEALELDLTELSTRRRFIIGTGGLLGAAALGACGAGEEAVTPTTTTGATRTIEHALGTTEVPVDPQRIVMLDYNALEELVALGKKPIGVRYDVQPFLQTELAGVEIVGNDDQPNLEKIITLNPDLIMDWEGTMGEGSYDNLTQIAPTVVSNRSGFTQWKESLRWTAAVVGQSDKAEELLDAYQQRVQQIRQTLGAERVAETAISVLAAFDVSYGLEIQVESFANTVLRDVGFVQPPAQQDLPLDRIGRASGLSLERIPVVDADAVFFINADVEDDYRSSIEGSPLWQQLEAVQAERVFGVGYHWREGSIVAANLILDDIEKYLTVESR